MATPEAEKRELSLSTDLFDKPAELIGGSAWAQLVLELLFLEKGTYPSLPEMGIGIQNYEYDFMDAAILTLQEEIIAQCHQYLPEVPLSQVNLSSTEIDGKPILLIYLTFVYDGKVEQEAVAAITQHRIIDFDVSW